MEYYYNELDPIAFQRLVSALLVARFGEDARVTPLIGKDGRRDFETAPGNPYSVFEVKNPLPNASWPAVPRSGRYVFQAKFHRTTDAKISEVRGRVISEFATELRNKILPTNSRDPLNYFFLVTNVPASADALEKVDVLRSHLLADVSAMHADIWWKDQVTAMLDLTPTVWPSFPVLFAGGRPPILADVIAHASGNLSRTIKLALRYQYNRDKIVKFRQIDLARELSRLFVDLDVDFDRLVMASRISSVDPAGESVDPITGQAFLGHPVRRSGALATLLNEVDASLKKIILEGGPGQGKSTLTQMVTQIYRQQLLGDQSSCPDRCPSGPHKHRMPFRIELRQYAEQLARDPSLSIDRYLATMISSDAGGVALDVGAIHDVVENSPVLLVLDGLDEVGSDELRDLVLEKIAEIVERFERDLKVDLKAIVTSRPPAIAGRQGKLPGYLRVPLAAMNVERVDAYLKRWLNVQLPDDAERKRVRNSFDARRYEPHVEALVKNPMQLAVLLHFIYLKDDAFPSRRSDLYQEYFKIVIDRDVEKSPALRREREIAEGLHRFLGFRIHALTEAQEADGSLRREHLLRHVGSWLEDRGDDRNKAYELFKLGEERLGLIVTIRGEGNHAYYGFEVQPIREYFAAAHINESELEAHILFEQMVRRPFWREVALFLAGLRRENEKADLVSRARQLDRDPKLGWKQDGRDVILQLAKEGTLSQPRHVLRESIDFIIDLLDPDVIPTPNDIKEFIPNVRKVLAAEGMDSHKRRLRSLLEKHRASSDAALLERLLSAVSGALGATEINDWILSYKGDTARRTAWVRLHLPYQIALPTGAPSQAARFWDGVQHSTWVRRWWLTGLEFRDAVSLSVPESFQSSLLERFAFEAFSGLGKMESPVSGCFAAWRLLDLQNILANMLMRRRDTWRDDLEEYMKSPVNYSGLSGFIEGVIREFVSEANNLLASCLNNQGRMAPEAVGAYFRAIGRFLEEPGYLGLLAAQMLWPLVAFSGRQPVVSNAKEDLAKVRQFYSLRRSSILRSGRRGGQSRLLSVRLSRGEPPVLIRDLVMQVIGRKSGGELEWVNNVPQSMSAVRSILDRCGVISPEVLAALCNMDFRGDAYRPLKTSQLQRVLGIARRSEEVDVVAGCILAVSGSKMVRLSGSDLLAKFIANPRRGVWFAHLVFQRYPNLHGGYPVVALAPDEVEILQEVSEIVTNDPKRFKIGAVLAANSFKVDHSYQNVAPLANTSGSISISI